MLQALVGGQGRSGADIISLFGAESQKGPPQSTLGIFGKSACVTLAVTGLVGLRKFASLTPAEWANLRKYALWTTRELIAIVCAPPKIILSPYGAVCSAHGDFWSSIRRLKL